jgi:hypothetical protein
VADRADPDEHHLATLLARLWRDSETLLSQQLALLGAELGENADRLVLGVLALLVGTAVVLIGGLAIATALILLLGHVMPLWVASALIGVLATAAGAALAFYGRRLVARVSVVPPQSWHALRETVDWLRQELT